MKPYGKILLLGLLPFSAILFLLIPLSAEVDEPSAKETVSPLTGYLPLSEKAFNPNPDASDEVLLSFPDPIAEDSTEMELNDPDSVSSLFPEIVPETLPIIETSDSPTTSDASLTQNTSVGSLPEPPTNEGSQNPAQLAAEPTKKPDLSLSGPPEIKRLPQSEEELSFPLILTIPGFDPEKTIVTDTGTGEETSSAKGSQSMDERNIAGPANPLLKISSPAVVGVGATLGGSASDLYIDALVPFWQFQSNSLHTIAFIVPRLSGSEDEENNGSLGIGVRSLRREGSFMGGSFPWIIGANAFYDYTHSSSNFDYNQFGAGIEWMSPFLDLRVNGYFPQSTENVVDETSDTSVSSSSSTASSTSYGSLFPSGHNVFQNFTTTTTTTFRRTSTTRFFEQYERALEGFDGEAGILLPDHLSLFPIRFYGGFYSFDNPYGEDITGPKARVEARPFTFLLLDASWYQDEELLGSNWFLGARAEITIGGGPHPSTSSKPLHDTTEGPKTEAYNPYASFHSRLVERIPRNYTAVLTTSPFLENVAQRQVSSSQFSTSETENGQITIASRLIFVDASRGSGTGAGTWQRPADTIQGGANLAIANLGSGGQVWTVWTQGEVGTYTEDVTVTNSVRFTSSSIPITGRNGQTFGGTGAGPVVQGGFLFGSVPAGPASPIIPIGSIQGYEITGGHTAASFAGITFVNVQSSNASRNRIDTIGGTGIEVINTGSTRASGTFASNGIFNTGGHAVHFDLANGSASSYTITDSGFGNLASNGVSVDAADSARYDIAITRTGVSGLSNAAIYLNAGDDSVGSVSVTNSSLNGGGVDANLTGNAESTLSVTGTRIANDPNSAFELEATDTTDFTARIRNNVIEDNQSAFAMDISGSAVSDTVFSGNNINNHTSNAVFARFESSGSQNLAISGNAIASTDGDGVVVLAVDGTVNATVSGNTVDTASGRGIVLRSSQTATMTAISNNNTTTNTSAGGVLVRATGTSNLDATLASNRISNSGSYGMRLQSDNASNLSGIVSNNTIRETVASALDVIGNDNSLIAVLAQGNIIADITTVGIQAIASDQSLLSLTAASNNISNTTEEGILFVGQGNSSSRFEARSNRIASIGNASGIRASFLGNHDTETILAENLIGPTAQQGIEIATSDNTTGDFTIRDNRINDSSQDGIRMTLFSTEDQTVALYGNNHQRTGANGINLATQGPKQVEVYSNTIGTTGGAAARIEMQAAGLVLNGANQGNNIYIDLTPVPFDDAGTAPFTGGVGILINDVVYP